MVKLMNPKVMGDTPPRVTEQPLYFNTATLSRFMRACYGEHAEQEARRHITAYFFAGEIELAEIWKRVLAHLCGIEIKEDTRRVVRAAKSLTVRT